MEIGVQTKGILPERDIDKAFEMIAKAGFNTVDINVDAFLLNSDVYAGKINPFFDSSVDDLVLYFKQYRRAMDANGIHPSQMHAPYPVYVEGRGKQNEYMQGNVIPKSIIIAEALGVPWVVIHPFKVQYIHGKEYERQLNVEYFKMLIPLLRQCKVKVCFENLYEGMGHRIVEGVCADPDDAIWYIDTLNEYAGEELFGLCLDTGHLQLVHRDPYSYIKVVGKRLKAVHIHENDGIGDLHQMPYTFGNEEMKGFDWKGLFRGLKEVGYSGSLSFETYPCMNSFPYAMSEMVLKTIHSVGEYMAGQIEGIISLGIVGTGRIADRMVNAIRNNELPVYVASVFNPKEQSAIDFAVSHHIDECFTDLDEMFDNVDAVYIASPHETHFSYAKRALEKGVDVLCEKPMALKMSEVEELYDLVKENNCVFMEAIKTAYCEGFKKLVEVAKSGVIGEIRDVEAAFTRLTPINTREFQNPDYNGSMLEFGSYVCLPAVKLLGTDIKDVTYKTVRGINGTDIYTKAYLEYANATATLKTGFGVKSEGQLLISGTGGYILAKSPWWLTKEFEVRFEDPNMRQVYKFDYEGSGLQYELKEFCEQILEGSTAAVLDEDESKAIACILENFYSWNEPGLRTRQQKFLIEAQKKMKIEPKIWAHRGLCHRYPENTLEAFEAAARLDGITGIELDVQFSKDKELVVIHDETLLRTTGIKGNVCDYTLEELKTFPIDRGNGTATTIPTLYEVLSCMEHYCREKGMLINIELKTSKIRYEGIEKATMDMVESFGLEDYIIYSSFLADSIVEVKKINPAAKTGALATYIGDCVAMARFANADALHPCDWGLNEELPEDMKGMPVRAWNCGEPFFMDGREFEDDNLIEYLQYGATELFTNVADEYLKR